MQCPGHRKCIPYSPLWHEHPGTPCEPQHHKWFVEHKASGFAVPGSPPSQCSTQYLVKYLNTVEGVLVLQTNYFLVYFYLSTDP